MTSHLIVAVCLRTISHVVSAGHLQVILGICATAVEEHQFQTVHGKLVFVAVTKFGTRQAGLFCQVEFQAHPRLALSIET